MKKNKKGNFPLAGELDYLVISFLMRGKRRNKVLYSLKSPQMPRDIADKCKLSISNVSASLKELLGKDLIKCITPNEKIFKFYQMTKKGQVAINHFEKHNNIS